MVVVVLGVGYLLLSLPMFAKMQTRFTMVLGLFSSNAMMDTSTFMRQQMIIAGFYQFLQTPWLGVGIGSTPLVTLYAVGYETYLHNNYIEMLAGGGLIGATLYYSIFFLTGIPLCRQQSNGDANTGMCLVLLVLMLLMDGAMVSYYEKGTYFFILLFFVQVQLNKRREEKTRYEENPATY